MNACSGAAGPTDTGSQTGWGGGCSSRVRWKPLEVVAVVIGFMIYWPIGLAMIGLKIAQRRGYSFDDAIAAARAKFSGFGAQAGRADQWRPFSAGSSGNSAFDDWRKAEMDRLEEERRKLDAAQREFTEHLNNLRRAKDREEFDRFMRERNAPGRAPDAPAA
jgi:hypothetical protein